MILPCSRRNVLCFLMLLAAAALAPAQTPAPAGENAATQYADLPDHPGRFITAGLVAPGGTLWVGTEDDGLFRWQPAQGSKWDRFTTKEGLAGNSIYALAVDHQGRLWAGHLREGLSIFDGKTWKTYGPVDGPLGARIFDIRVCPTDGDVWIAASAGLCRYSVSANTWSYFGRPEGLPADQVRKIAFDKAGNLYLGMFVDGLVIGKAQDQYKKWRQVTAKDSLPSSAAGEGLPSNLINDLVVGPDDVIYVGTPHGLAYSTDQGEHFQFIRGKDWLDNVRGAYSPRNPADENASGLMSQDWVTCLAPWSEGKILIGHRQTSWDLLDVHKSAVIDQAKENQVGLVTKIIPVPGSNNVMIGRYADGLSSVILAGDALAPMEAPALPAAAFPLAAKPPTPAELDALLQQAASPVNPKPASGQLAAFLTDDWVTQGDWIGRYGRRFAQLCPSASMIASGAEENVSIQRGPHRHPDDPGDGVSGYYDPETYLSSSWLFDPATAKRRIGEFNDGTMYPEQYPWPFDGPDLWLQIHVGEGISRVSLYFLNPNGHSGYNRFRDQVIELRSYDEDLAKALARPPLATTRVADYWAGVYKQFVVNGPKTYYVRIARNHTFATRINGIFIDKLQGAPDAADAAPIPTSLKMDPPVLGAEVEVAPGREALMEKAIALWTQLDKSYDNPALLKIGFHPRARLLAYRAAVAAEVSEPLLAQWRWQIGLWTDADRQRFNDAIKSATPAETP